MTALEKLRLQNLTEEEQELKKKNNLLKIDNNFIESFLVNNNIVVMKILFYISRTKQSKKNYTMEGAITTFTLDTKILCEYCQISMSSLKSSLTRLHKTIITTVNTEEELEKITLIPRTKIIHNKNRIEIDLYNKVVDLIIEVDRKYTTIDFSNIVKLKHKHSLKMIQLLEQIEGYDDWVGKRKTFTLDELNLLFGTNYKNNPEFERRIFKPIKEDLDQNSKLTFIYESMFQKNPSGVGRPKSVGFKIDLVSNKNRQPKLL